MSKYEKKPKRTLLAALIGEVEQWSGEAGPGRRHRKRMERLTEMLGRCDLAQMEREWLALARIWLFRATARPEPWIWAFWLSTLRAWLDWVTVAESGDSRPTRYRPAHTFIVGPSPTYRDFLMPRPLV